MEDKEIPLEEVRDALRWVLMRVDLDEEEWGELQERWPWVRITVALREAVRRVVAGEMEEMSRGLPTGKSVLSMLAEPETGE